MHFSIVFTPLTEDCLSSKLVLKTKDHMSEKRPGQNSEADQATR